MREEQEMTIGISGHGSTVRTTFVSIEGESTRIGRYTGFVLLGNGPMLDIDQMFERLVSQGLRDACDVVLGVTPMHHREWRPLAQRFITEAEKFGYNVIIETAGEKLHELVGNERRYVELTEGITTVTPQQLRPGVDEVKALVYRVRDVVPAIETLKPFSEAGITSFVLCRCGFPPQRGGVNSEMYDIYQRFMDSAPGEVRIMLMEHEVVGID